MSKYRGRAGERERERKREREREREIEKERESIPLGDSGHVIFSADALLLSGHHASKHGTYTTVKTRFRPWHSGKTSLNPFKLFTLRSEADQLFTPVRRVSAPRRARFAFHRGSG